MKKIFISCVSSEFKSLRNKAAAALNRNYHSIYQEDFNFEPISLKKSLKKQLENCHGIIHIVGDGYGAEFPPNDPECNPDGNISYTQWELRMVEEMNRKSFRKKSIWLIFPEPDCSKDTAPEWLDWPMNEELSDEDRMAIQQRRRELQLSYKQSLLANRNNYGFRKPKNDYEFNQVIDALVKKEKKKQHIFAFFITMLCFGAILAGFWGYQNQMKSSYRKEIDRMEGDLRELPNKEKFITPKYYKIEENWQPLFMSSLMASSLTRIKASDQNAADLLIKELSDHKKLGKIERERLDGMLKQIDNLQIKSDVLHTIASYVFLMGDFEYANQLIDSVDCGLDKISKLRSLFEIQYNIFVRASSSDSTLRKTESIKDALDKAISAMEELDKHDPESKSYNLYEFDMLDLMYQRLDFFVTSKDKIDDKSLKEIDLIATNLSDATKKLKSRNEEIRSQMGILYTALANQLRGSARMQRAKQDYDYKEYKEAGELFNAALGDLHNELDNPNKWALQSDEKQALRTIANIYEEFWPLFQNWNRFNLDNFQKENSEFKLKLAAAKVYKETESTKEWKFEFKKSREAYNSKSNEINKESEDCLNLFNERFKNYEALKDNLKRYPDEPALKMALDKVGEVEQMLKEAQSKSDGYRQTLKENLAEAEAVLTEKDKKPDTILIHDLTSIEKCLSELDIPNLEGAKRCIEKLDKLAKDSKEEKAIIQNAIELSNLIKKIFTAEANLKAAQGGIVTAENEAAIKEDRAREYLKPNGFGTVRTEMARKNFTDAETLRRNAKEKLATTEDSVTEQMRQVVLSAKIYNDSYQKRGGAVLAGLAYAVMKRTGISYDGEMPLSEEEVAIIKNEGKTVEGVIKGE